MTATIQRDAGGVHIVWYEDDDNDSGYGEDARMALWYAGRVDYETAVKVCEERIKQGPPPDNQFVNL
ncbi:MAG: hypothetical protein GF334_10275 [Candidatus Altiarchaeales archaeon]|nr:hypothetical protein [Candidatus Altiarchaeales archaeon]